PLVDRIIEFLLGRAGRALRERDRDSEQHGGGSDAGGACISKHGVRLLAKAECALPIRIVYPSFCFSFLFSFSSSISNSFCCTANFSRRCCNSWASRTSGGS